MSKKLNLSEVHIVADRSFFNKVRKGFYTFDLTIPEYAVHDLYHYKHHIKFYFYHDKKSKPWLSTFYCNAECLTNVAPNTYEFTVKKSPKDTESNDIALETRWSRKYGPWMKFGKQDYYIFGFRPSGSLDLNCGLREIKSIRQDIWMMSDRKCHYWHCAESIDRLTYFYEGNLERIFEASRMMGLTYIYIGDMVFATPKRNHEGLRVFDNWVSGVSDIVNGMGSGGGNSDTMSYGDVTFLIKPEQANKVYNVWTGEVITAKRIINTFDKHAFRTRNSSWKADSDSLYRHYTDFLKTRELPMRRVDKIPEKALDLYNQYLDVRDKYLSKLGTFMYDRDYRIVETKWRTDFEGLVFVTDNYDGICKIKINENSDRIKGPWVYGEKPGPLIDIHCQDSDLQEELLALPFSISTTFAKEMLDLLTEVRYISMADKTIARLKGEV